MPGLVILRAVFEGETIGAALRIVQGDKSYAHLSAFSDRGYELGASYALNWAALELLADRTSWLDWGGWSWHYRRWHRWSDCL